MAGRGRPPKYSNADELSVKIDEYFIFVQGEKITKQVLDPKTGELNEVDVWIRHPERITVTGLALFLGFADRQSLQDYKAKKQFSFPIKRAMTRIEQEYENQLFERNPSGAIFALKNFGWRDKTEVDVDHTTGGDPIQWNEVKTYTAGKDAE